ncbi:MAG: PAS domain-containing protein, partial [Planctomycetes bacterium]|nr:PAS domain-containing protein [Planctomycetota bacterium]
MPNCMWNKNGEVEGLLGIFTDITTRFRSEALAVEWRNRYEAAVQVSKSILYDWDAETNEVVYGGNLEKTLGYTVEEMQGGLAHWQGLIHPEDREHFNNVIAHLVQTREPTLLEYRVRKKEGEYIPVEDNGRFFLNADGRPVRMVGFVADISNRKQAELERKELEKKMRHTQKLESLGVLAGGIAHDFNNLLMDILGNADLALGNLSKVSPARPCIEEIEKASKRAADLCRQMLAYSGKGRFDIMAVDLSEVVKEMLPLLESSISKKAILKTRLGHNLSAVETDVVQLQQIIMNLIINASEAIKGAAGEVTVTTGSMACTRAYLNRSRLPEIPPEGEFVYIEVADTGCGMDEETKEKLFDPFFTTKFTGRGLGLSAVLGIVRGHKGAIIVESEAEKGTTFRVLLPVAAMEAEKQVIGEEGKRDLDWRGSGTILLADDEEIVLNVTRQMLERMGFEVITASNGQEAIERFRENAGKIVSVILDFTMPKMNGEEAFG